MFGHAMDPTWALNIFMQARDFERRLACIAGGTGRPILIRETHRAGQGPHEQ